MPDFTVSRCGNNSEEMRVSLPQEKKYKIISQCQNILKEKSVYVREMGQMLCRLSSTAIVVLVALLQYQTIQRQKIAELVNTKKNRFVVCFEIEGLLQKAGGWK